MKCASYLLEDIISKRHVEGRADGGVSDVSGHAVYCISPTVRSALSTSGHINRPDSAGCRTVSAAREHAGKESHAHVVWPLSDERPKDRYTVVGLDRHSTNGGPLSIGGQRRGGCARATSAPGNCNCLISFARPPAFSNFFEGIRIGITE